MLDIDNWSTIIFLFNFSFQIFRCRILFNIRSFAIVLLINILYYIPMSHVASLVNKELDTVYIMSYMHDANVHIFFHISVIGVFFHKMQKLDLFHFNHFVKKTNCLRSVLWTLVSIIFLSSPNLVLILFQTWFRWHFITNIHILYINFAQSLRIQKNVKNKPYLPYTWIN